MKRSLVMPLLPAVVLAVTVIHAGYAQDPLDLSGIAASRCIAGTTSAGSPSAYSNRGAVNAFNGSGIADDGKCGVTADNEMFMLS